MSDAATKANAAGHVTGTFAPCKGRRMQTHDVRFTTSAQWVLRMCCRWPLEGKGHRCTPKPLRACFSVRMPLANQSRKAAHLALSTTRLCAPPGVACTPAMQSSACAEGGSQALHRSSNAGRQFLGMDGTQGQGCVLSRSVADGATNAECSGTASRSW